MLSGFCLVAGVIHSSAQLSHIFLTLLALESLSGAECLSQSPTHTALLMRMGVKNHSGNCFKLSDTPLSHKVESVLNDLKSPRMCLYGCLARRGQTQPRVSKGMFLRARMA